MQQMIVDQSFKGRLPEALRADYDRRQTEAVGQDSGEICVIKRLCTEVELDNNWRHCLNGRPSPERSVRGYSPFPTWTHGQAFQKGTMTYPVRQVA